jgi:predicted dehydrogenase
MGKPPRDGLLDPLDVFGSATPLPSVAIVGCGDIVNEAHLPVYQRHGVPVAGVFDVAQDVALSTARTFGIDKVYSSYDELLSDPTVDIVDIATHPSVRPDLICQALDRDKHVFAQKPLARDLVSARRVLARCAASDRKVAVNQNARWAPPWRMATHLIADRAIGDLIAITHLQNTDFAYMTGTVFDRDPHFTILDFSVHWLDIIRCWTEGAEIAQVRARQYRVPTQPVDSRTPWGLLIDVAFADGMSATVRGTGSSSPITQGHPFWIHGTRGTLRGSVRHHEFLELERDGHIEQIPLDGEWYLDGFAGAFAELVNAIRQDREPYNSVAHNMITMEMVLAACRSADQGGIGVSLGDIPS